MDAWKMSCEAQLRAWFNNDEAALQHYKALKASRDGLAEGAPLPPLDEYTMRRLRAAVIQEILTGVEDDDFQETLPFELIKEYSRVLKEERQKADQERAAAVLATLDEKDRQILVDGFCMFQEFVCGLSTHERAHEVFYRDSLDRLEAAREKLRSIERPVSEDDLQLILKTLYPDVDNEHKRYHQWYLVGGCAQCNMDMASCAKLQPFVHDESLCKTYRWWGINCSHVYSLIPKTPRLQLSVVVERPPPGVECACMTATKNTYNCICTECERTEVFQPRSRRYFPRCSPEDSRGCKGRFVPACPWNTDREREMGDLRSCSDVYCFAERRVEIHKKYY
jgi:hypothetical protein